jgi:hypothetical protein
MEHWGDPWADADANHDEPPKHEVATPPPQHASFAPAPVLLNGFLDDAGWGSNEDEGFGGWAAEPPKVEETAETRVNGTENQIGWDAIDDKGTANESPKEQEENLPERNGWNVDEEDTEALRLDDNVDPETSDSATTIHADDVAFSAAKDSAEPLHADDDLSTRPSTSPSDTSRNETSAESPRTSFEEDRSNEKCHISRETVEKEASEAIPEEGVLAPEPTQVEGEQADEDFGDFEEDHLTQDTPEEKEQLDTSFSEGEESRDVQQNESKDARPPSHESGTKHGLDQGLLSQLFRPAKMPSELPEAPDDPVSSTSTRKAWYRLSRKQTMREYNSGTVDDNYVRVNWKTSHIRSEVVKTVSRWATEDRMAGRGPGARASFYWDTPAPPPMDPFHARKKSSISVSSPVGMPTRDNVPKLETDVPAAFNWSSPSAGANPWGEPTEDVRAVSSPVVPPKHTSVARLQRQERPVSADLTPRPKDPTSHKRTATTVDLFNGTAPAPLISPLSPPKPPTTTPADPWATLGALDTNPPPAPTSNIPQADDEDEDWGEMVESPVVSAKTPIADMSAFSAPPSRNATVSTPSTTPRSIRSSPLQPLPPTSGSKHASPIVRLKGTVSPTSALFKANAFVPASVEDGPIGPGMLKARKRETEPTADSPPRAMAQLDEVLDTTQADATVPRETVSTPEDEFSPFEASLPSPTPDPAKATSPPPPQTHTDPEPEPTHDLDLSIFDTPLLSTSTSTAAPPPPISASNDDPWSIFDDPAPAPIPKAYSTRSTRSTSTTSTPSAFTRTPPRPMATPPKQPLTSATSSAQRRKAEEDEIIRAIIEGLPDLGYMLR